MNWYVVHTKLRQEKVAETNLKRLGVETFFPLLKRNKSVRRKQQQAIEPLFPGYLFSRFDLERHYRAVNFSQGVRRLVTFGDNAATIEDQVIEAMKSRLQNGYVTIQPSSFMPGQTVKILGGPFQEFEAIFEREIGDHERVILLLQTVSYQARVVVDIRDVVNS